MCQENVSERALSELDKVCNLVKCSREFEPNRSIANNLTI